MLITCGSDLFFLNYMNDTITSKKRNKPSASSHFDDSESVIGSGNLHV